MKISQPKRGGWTIHGSQGRAEVTDDLDFGNIDPAVNGVSWYSLFKGANYYDSRAQAASLNIANGSAGDSCSVTASFSRLPAPTKAETAKARELTVRLYVSWHDGSPAYRQRHACKLVPE